MKNLRHLKNNVLKKFQTSENNVLNFFKTSENNVLNFQTCSDLFGPVWMRSDVRSDAFGHFWKIWNCSDEKNRCFGICTRCSRNRAKTDVTSCFLDIFGSR